MLGSEQLDARLPPPLLAVLSVRYASLSARQLPSDVPRRAHLQQRRQVLHDGLHIPPPDLAAVACGFIPAQMAASLRDGENNVWAACNLCGNEE